mmetsp:Transcript_32982/g.37520  ORF Transcript_32982/g.37520 Transcript_32982/m.37520 type:complete len:101 (+) Transcript_32982:139-441(+)
MSRLSKGFAVCMYNMATSDSTEEPNLNFKTRRVSMYNVEQSPRKQTEEQNYEIERVGKTTNNIENTAMVLKEDETYLLSSPSSERAPIEELYVSLRRRLT